MLATPLKSASVTRRVPSAVTFDETLGDAADSDGILQALSSSMVGRRVVLVLLLLLLLVVFEAATAAPKIGGGGAVTDDAIILVSPVSSCCPRSSSGIAVGRGRDSVCMETARAASTEFALIADTDGSGATAAVRTGSYDPDGSLR